MEHKKKHKLTAEEKKLLKEQKKREKKLRAEELKRKIRRDHLQRELEYGDRNRKKLEKFWQQLLFDMKIPELREQLELAIVSAEYKLDMKDFTISFLLDQLDGADEQTRMNMTAHSEDTREMIAQFDDKLKEMRESFEVVLHDILQDSQMEQCLLEEQFEAEQVERQLAIDEMQQQGPEVLRSELKTRMDALEKKHLAETETQRGTLENRYEAIWDKYLVTLKTYLDNTEKTRNEYEELVRIEEKHLKDNQKLKSYVASLKEYLRLSKEQQVDEQEDYERRIKCVTEDLKVIHQKVKTGQNILSEALKLDKEQLIVVAEETNAVLKEINALTEKGKKILRWVSLCRKYETRQEQIFPVPKLEGDTGPGEESKSETDEDLKKMLDSTDKLKGLWIKHNKVEMSLIVMKDERKRLKHENQMLKTALAHYCSRATLQCPKHVPIPRQ